MEEEGTNSITSQSKYVPNELIHRIQLLLPKKDATRTCVLSKSWLHAWSTIPTIGFTKCVTNDHLTKQEEIDYIQLIDRTLLRYLNDNMSIDCLHLHLDPEILSMPSPIDTWFQALACGDILKGLSLTICGKNLARKANEVGSLTLPDGKNLNTISVRDDIISLCQVRMKINPVIKCSSLRVLELVGVGISEEALHNIFSSCSLLEKINIHFCQHLERVKVKNLRFLCELQIRLALPNDILEIDNVPSLRLFCYYSISEYAIRIDTLGSIRELELNIPKVDNAFFNMIKSKFPFLEILILAIHTWMLETLDITSLSLKRLTLRSFLDRQINLHVYASKLLYFFYIGRKMPSLLFPSNTPVNIKLRLNFHKTNPIDLSFFLKVREALDLSSNFDIEIEDNFVPLDIELDDLQRMVPFPARNVQQLSFGKNLEKKLWKHSPFIDFLFSICYPRYVKVFYRSSKCKNYWYEQMVEIMEKKTCDLKDIEIKNPGDGKWETLTESWRSFHSLFELPGRNFINDEGNDYNSDEFKLNWWS